ncbi:hypothetical protein CRENBAI_016491 [Crenichthys baileyi]|uniref:Uncharacterized protein n=1 Tax=Crenichthys baileyi TaxID=28760 RepID=A0AAV9S804_9TELE
MKKKWPRSVHLADGRQASSMDLFTFLSREAEKTLRRSAGLSVQSAYDGSKLAIPCPGTGPLRRCSPPVPLAAHFGPALKPSPSSRRKKRRRGAPSCSAGEEVVSLPADVRAAASKPASSPATALSPRLAAAPPMPSSLAPARCSEAAPDELEQRLRFFARQIQSFRRTSLMYSSPELMERIRQMEMDYETAVTQFYCRPPSTSGLQGAASEQPTPGLQGAASEQPTSCLQRATAAVEQPMSGLHRAAAAVEQPTSGLQTAAAAVEQPTSGLQSTAAVEQPTSAAPSDPVPEGFKKQFVLVLASEPRDEGFEEEVPSDPVPEGFKEQFVLVLASEPRDEGSPGPASASEGLPGSASASEGLPGSASASEGSPGSASEGSPGSASEGSPGSASEGSSGLRRRPRELCACFWPSCHSPHRPPWSGCFCFC